MQDTKFMTAAEKDRVLRAWESFLKSGLKEEKFTKALYDHLMQNCSFIAHYNRGGFYDTYFTSGDGRVQFLSQFDAQNAGQYGHPPSVEYGDLFSWCKGDYEDINTAMINVAAEYIPLLLTEAKEEQKNSDIAKAQALLTRHNIKLERM